MIVVPLRLQRERCDLFFLLQMIGNCIKRIILHKQKLAEPRGLSMPELLLIAHIT